MFPLKKVNHKDKGMKYKYLTNNLHSECTKYDFHGFDSIRLCPHENLLIDRQPTKLPVKLATKTKLLSWFWDLLCKNWSFRCGLSKGGPFVKASNNGLQKYANELGGAEKSQQSEQS